MVTHLSHSSIKLYQTCGRKFKFHYIDRVPSPKAAALAFGIAFHEVAERCLRAHVAGVDHDPPALFAGAWASASADVDDWAGKEPDDYLAEGERMFEHPAVLMGLYAIRPRIGADGRPMLEERAQLIVPGLPPIVGRVDVVEDDGAIGDLKTASRSWTPQQAMAEVQPLIYCAAMHQAGHLEPPYRFRHRVFVKTREPKTQVIETTRTQEEIDWLIAGMVETHRAIEGGHFPPNPLSCYAYGRPCEFWSLCRPGQPAGADRD